MQTEDLKTLALEKLKKDNDKFIIKKILPTDNIKVDKISGATIYLTITRELEDNTLVFKRIHKRDHIRKILKDLEIVTVQVTEFTKEAFISKLKELGINLTEKKHNIFVTGAVATIDVAHDSLMTYGKAEVRLTK